MAMGEGSVVECVEGTLTMVAAIAANQRGTGEHGAWILQNIIIKDDAGNEIRATIKSPDLELEQKEKGNRIRITAYKGDRGLSGIKVKKYKEKSQLDITATANVEILGPGGLPKDRPSSGSSSGSRASTEQSGATQGRDNSVTKVEGRISLYATVLDLVCKDPRITAFVSHAPNGHEIQKDIATTMFLSFKGQYGVYADVEFAGVEQPKPPAPPAQQRSAPDQKAAPPEPQSTEAVGIKWEEFIHPSTGVALGKAAADERMRYAVWAITAKGNLKTEAARFKMAVLQMVAAMKWTLKSLVLGRIGLLPECHSGEINESEILAYFKVQSMNQLTDERAEEFHKTYDVEIASLKAFVSDSRSNQDQGPLSDFGGEDGIPF